MATTRRQKREEIERERALAEYKRRALRAELEAERERHLAYALLPR